MTGTPVEGRDVYYSGRHAGDTRLLRGGWGCTSEKLLRHDWHAHYSAARGTARSTVKELNVFVVEKS